MIDWEGDGVRVIVDTGPDAPPKLVHLAPTGAAIAGAGRSAVPLVELMLAGVGSRSGASAGSRHTDGLPSLRLRYARHTDVAGDGHRTLSVTAVDPVSGLEVTTHLRRHSGLPVLRCWTSITHAGTDPVTLQYVSSLGYSGFGTTAAGWPALGVAHNSWCGEARWRENRLDVLGLQDLGLAAQGFDSSRGRVAVTSTGTFPSGEHLPTGYLRHPEGPTWMWRIEHNGSWHWEVGDRRGDLYLMVSGPTDAENQWSRRLAPGDTFTSVPVSIAAVPGGPDDAVAALTEHHRRRRRPQTDHQLLPVIFNDYMNCLDGDPSTDKLLPLVDAAADLGAEYFCVDAGWYADDGTWWDSVGDWQPSTRRFPDGLAKVTRHIADHGLTSGLWLEPEVVGVRSEAARRLPAEAFFHRLGTRVVESGRHQLDLRHPAARAHVDATVNRLVADLGVGYLKLDYNINAGVGTDVAADSAGDGLLGHNTALLAWYEDVQLRHPGLTLESCASGGMRMDGATLAVLPLQSVTDQHDPVRLAAIAAAVPSVVAPEQAAIWVYPQPHYDRELNALCMVNGLLGRIHLSGRADLLTLEQRDDVRRALTVYRRIRHRIPRAVPFWPLGFPAWDDEWLALGLRDGLTAYVAVWRRSAPGSGPARCALPMPAGVSAVRCSYPADLPGDYTAADGGVVVSMPVPVGARLLEVDLR